MNNSKNVARQLQADLAQCLDAAMTCAATESQRCGDRQDYARSVAWGAVAGRIMQILTNVPASSHEPSGPAPVGRTTADLLSEAERCTRTLVPGPVGGVPAHVTVDLLDLIREVQSLATY